jgi:hypothetical protein
MRQDRTSAQGLKLRNWGFAAPNHSKDSSPRIVRPSKDKRMVATDEHGRRIAQSRDGDHGAFEALIKEHQRMIHSLCYRMIGSLAEAGDLTQGILIPGYRRLSGCRGEARFSRGQGCIAGGHHLNGLQRRRPHQWLNSEWAKEGLGQLHDDLAHAQRVKGCSACFVPSNMRPSSWLRATVQVTGTMGAPPPAGRVTGGSPFDSPWQSPAFVVGSFHECHRGKPGCSHKAAC